MTLKKILHIILIALAGVLLHTEQVWGQGDCDLSFDPLPDATYGQNYEATISVNGGDETTFTFSEDGTWPDGWSIQDGKITGNPTSAGTVTLNIRANDGSTCNEVYPCEIEISKATPAIQFTLPADKEYGDTDFQISASSESTGAITYSIVSGSAATVSDDMITITGVGSVTIRATQAADDNYESTYAEQTIEIIKATPSIQFALPADKKYGDADFQISASSESTGAFTYSIVSGSAATVSDDMITITGVGSVTIRTTQAADDNYESTYAEQILTITKGSLSIDFSLPTNWILGDGNTTYQINVSSPSDGIPSYTSSNTNVATVDASGEITIVGAGSTDITVSQAEGTNYLAASLPKVLTIGDAQSPSITFDLPTDRTYGDENITYQIVASSPSSGAFTYASSDLSVATVNVFGEISIVGAGSTDITVSQAANGIYTAGQQTKTLTIAKANQTITFETPTPRTFGEVPFALSATASSGLPVEFNSSSEYISISGGQVTILGAGTAEINANQPGNNNYNAAPQVTRNLVIHKATPTIGFDLPTGWVLGDGNITYQINVTTLSDGTLSYTSSNTNVATVDASGEISIVGAGSTTITVSQAEGTNYLAASLPKVLAISDAQSPAITFDLPTDRTYGDGNTTYQITASSPSSGIFSYVSSNQAVATVNASGEITIVGAGSTDITVSQVASGIYTEGQQTKTLTVAKANQTITFETPTPRTFGETPFALSATASSGLPVEFSSTSGYISISGGQVTILGAGTAEINANQPGNNNYNAALQVTRNLVINKAVPTIGFNLPSGWILGDGHTTYQVSVTSPSNGILSYASSNEQVATVNASGEITIKGAGSTTITVSQAAGTNYLGASLPKVLTIGDAQSPVITFDLPTDRTYADGNTTYQIVASSLSSGAFSYASSNQAVATVNASGLITIVGAGSTDITISQAASGIYTAGQQTKTLTIAKANQTITFETPTPRTFGEVPFALSATASSGLPVEFSSTSEYISISGGQVTILGTGTAGINANQPGNNNYNAASQVTRNLVIHKAVPTIGFDLPSGWILGDGHTTYQIPVTSPSNGTLSYASSNTNVATVNASGLITIKGAGSTTITVSQAEGTNYLTGSLQKILVIGDAQSPVITFNLPASWQYGDGNTTYQIEASSNSSGAFSYASSNQAVATVNASGLITIVGAGSTDITISQAASGIYTAGQQTKTLTIAKANQTITFETPAPRTFGEAPFALSSTASSGLPVEFSSTSEYISISGSQATILGAGNAEIQANQPGNNNYNAAVQVTRNLVIHKATPTIGFDLPTGWILGDGHTTYQINATTLSDGTLSYASSNTNVATVNASGLITIKGAGSTTITVSQAEGTNYLTGSLQKALVIGDAQSPAITFDLPASWKYGDGNTTYRIEASSNSSGAFTYASSNPNVATVNASGEISVMGAGSTNITVSQAASGIYTAGQLTKTLVIAKGDLTIGFSLPTGWILGDGNTSYQINVTTPSDGTLSYVSSNTNVAAVNASGLITIVGAGSTTITVSQAAGTHYLATSLPKTFTIGNPQSPAIAFDLPASWKYGDGNATYQVVASSPSSGAFTYSSSNPNVAIVNTSGLITIRGAGSTNITVSQAASGIYAAGQSTQTLTIGKGTPTITFEFPTNKKGGDPDFTVNASSNSTGTFTYTSSNPSVASITPAGSISIRGIGNTTITASLAADNNYLASSAERTLTVSCPTITISSGTDLPTTMIAGQPFNQTLQFTGGSGKYNFRLDGNLPTGLTWTYTTSSLTISGTPSTNGTYSFTFDITDQTYSSCTHSQSYTIEVGCGGGMTISIPSLPAGEYGTAYNSGTGIPIGVTGGVAPYTYRIPSGSGIIGMTISANGTFGGTPTESGTKYVSIEVSDKNNCLASTEVTITINKAPLTVVAESKTRIYNTENPPLTYTLSGIKYPADEAGIRSIISLTSSATKTSNVGTYQISLKENLEDMDNYSISHYTPNNLTISRATQTISFPDLASVIYGEADFQLTASASSGLTVTYEVTKVGNIDAIEIKNGNTVSIKNAGSAIITARQSGNNNYYSAESITKTLTVNKARLRVKAKNITREYGEIVPALALEYTSTDFKNGDTPESLVNPPAMTTEASRTSPVNTYPISVSSTNLELNYTYETQNGTLTIAQAPLILQADDKTRRQGADNPTFTYTGTGLKNGESTSSTGFWTTSPQLTCNAIPSSDPGTYPITISDGTTKNYKVTGHVNGMLTVTDKPILTVTVSNASMTYGDPNLPAFTLVYNGFEPGDDKSRLDTEPKITIPSHINERTSAGTYDITASGGVDDKYDFDYEAGKLTINRAPLTVTVNNSQRRYGESNPTFTFSYTGWRNNDNEAGLTTFPVASCLANANFDVGAYEIRITNPGSSTNYNITADETQEKYLTIVPADQTISWMGDLPEKTYGDASSVISATASSGQPVTFTSDNPGVAGITVTAGVTRITIVGAGTATITASQAGTKNYNPAPEVKKILTVKKLQQTIEDFHIEGLVGNEVTYARDRVLTLSARTRTGDTDNPGLEDIEFKASDPNTGIISISGNKITVHKAGSVVITANQPGDDNYAAATEATLTLTIKKATPSVQFSPFSTAITYGYSPVLIDVTVPEGVQPTFSSGNENIAIIDDSYVRITGAGTANITCYFPGNENYTEYQSSQLFTVHKAKLTIKPDDKKRQIGKPNPVFTSSYKGFVYGESRYVLTGTLAYECDADLNSDIGVYEIAVSGVEASNYDITFEKGFLTVTDKVQLQVSVLPVEREYGEENPDFELQYSGFEDDDTEASLDQLPEAHCSAAPDSKPGTYIITLSGGQDSKYDFNYTSGELIIHKATLTVTAKDETKDYGDPNPEFTRLFSGFKLDEDPSVIDRLPNITCSAGTESAVGAYQIIVSGGYDDCYDFEYINGTLTILALFSFGEQPAVTYGDDPFEIRIDIYGSIQLSELAVSATPEDVLEVWYDDRDTKKWKARILNAGTVDLTAVLRDDQGRIRENIRIEVRKRTLNVKAGDYERKQGEANPAGWEVTYSGFIDGENENDLDVLPVAVCSAQISSPPGNYPITFTEGSDRNYTFVYEAGNLRIIADEQPEKEIPTAFTPNGDGINDTFAPGHKVKIFNRLGTLVFEGSDGWDGTYKGRKVEAGIYFYITTSPQGMVRKGTIEVTRRK